MWHAGDPQRYLWLFAKQWKLAYWQTSCLVLRFYCNLMQGEFLPLYFLNPCSLCFADRYICPSSPSRWRYPRIHYWSFNSAGTIFYTSRFYALYCTVLFLCSSGTRSACINAATLALADAGIPMRDLVTSCSAGYLNNIPLLGKYTASFI